MKHIRKKDQPFWDQKKEDPEKGFSVLTGLIIPVQWNEKGEITKVALSTYDEEEYLITNNEKFEELSRFLRQEVELTGSVIQNNKVKSIQVHSFNVKSITA